jgi:ankyrin repeat protein
MWASKRGHADIVIMLIQAGANANYQDSQVTLLCTTSLAQKQYVGSNWHPFCSGVEKIHSFHVLIQFI